MTVNLMKLAKQMKLANLMKLSKTDETSKTSEPSETKVESYSVLQTSYRTYEWRIHNFFLLI